jgi:hypothetical protein
MTRRDAAELELMADKNEREDALERINHRQFMRLSAAVRVVDAMREYSASLPATQAEFINAAIADYDGICRTMAGPAGEYSARLAAGQARLEKLRHDLADVDPNSDKLREELRGICERIIQLEGEQLRQMLLMIDAA